MDCYGDDRKKRRIVKVISVYRVCNQRNAQGTCTIYLQQQNDLIQAKHENTDPREVILEDLQSVITEDHKKGKVVILAGDMNDSIANSRRLQTFLNETGMFECTTL